MVQFARGTMVISLDLELAWGRFDTIPVETLSAEATVERMQIKRLLALMDQYEIPATWAVVGHLMLDSCQRDADGDTHPETAPHARFSWFPRDWYSCDPCTTASQSPGWYGPEIVDWIRGARVRHEIASHSFAHILYGDPECDAAVTQADLCAVVETAAQRGIALTSFVFPRNRVGHLELLQRFGFRAYRGVGPPHPLRDGNVVLRKAVSALDGLLGFLPSTVRAKEVLPGLWNIPGSYCYLPHEGYGRVVPVLSRVVKARNAIKRAIKNGEVYHLWLHPFNLNTRPDLAFRCLERIFSYAHGMREKGLLDIYTMDEYAQRLGSGKTHAGTTEEIRP